MIGCGDPIKASLRDEGHTHVVALLAEGNTGEGFDSAYGVLGNVGLYLGALRRHELTNPGARRAVAVPGSLIARAARRRIARDGAEILDRAPGDAQPGARRRTQELYIAARRIPVHR